MKQLKKLLVNHTKAAGPDNIRPRVLDELANELAILFVKFDRSIKFINTGEVRQDWRSAKVSPVYKKVNDTKLRTIDQSHYVVK
jgi:hypothetical protein